MRKFGLITAAIMAVVMMFAANELPISERIPIALTIGWVGYNIAAYRGRYRPRIFYAVKVGYPVFILILLFIMTGKA